MCGRFTLRTPAHLIAKYFNLDLDTQWQTALRYNISPTQDVPVIRTTDGHRKLSMMRWGFVPSWAKDAKIAASINAVGETVTKMPMFRSAIKRRRCLVPADGFYEWKKTLKNIRGDAPWYFQVKSGKPFAFAGIWERWEGGDTPLESCVILTTTPNELIVPIHNRMPVILSPSRLRCLA